MGFYPTQQQRPSNNDFSPAPGNAPRRFLLDFPPSSAHAYSMNRARHILSRYTFIGKEEDRTKEHDFGPRYYSADLGRFLAPDPILSGASPYAYAGGNPVMYYDPTGLMWGSLNPPSAFQPGGEVYEAVQPAEFRSS